MSALNQNSIDEETLKTKMAILKKAIDEEDDSETEGDQRNPISQKCKDRLTINFEANDTSLINISSCGTPKDATNDKCVENGHSSSSTSFADAQNTESLQQNFSKKKKVCDFYFRC